MLARTVRMRLGLVSMQVANVVFFTAHLFSWSSCSVPFIRFHDFIVPMTFPPCTSTLSNSSPKTDPTPQSPPDPSQYNITETMFFENLLQFFHLSLTENYETLRKPVDKSV